MSVIVFAALCLMLAAAFTALRLHSNQRLRQLDRQLATDPHAGAPARCTPEQLLAERREMIAALREQAGDARSRRLQAEQLTGDTEARYVLAVQGAHDGFWEWDLATGEVYYSPAWKGLLGLEESDIGSGFDEWTNRIHPDERAGLEAALDRQLSGPDPQIELQHRLRHRDGGWRWMLTRATVLRDTHGKAYRVVALTSDISKRRQAEQTLLDVANGLSTLSGADCYQMLVRKLAEIVGAPEAFLCVCIDQPATRVRMLAHWKPDGEADLEDFELEGTPCRDVIEQGRTVFVTRDAGKRWPKEYEDCGLEAYLGLPCFDTRGRVIGHLACTSTREMMADLPHQAVLKLFALRAAVELERARAMPEAAPTVVNVRT